MKVKKLKNFDGIFSIDGKLATINLISGLKHFNEEVVKSKKIEYRIWDPYTSKPSAAIKKGIKVLPIKEGTKILYLGLADGKTASFFSDIIKRKGIIYGVEISEKSLRNAICVSEHRGNIVPILADARKVETYENIVLEKVDLVYEDVASPDQVQILIRNSKRFLKPKGFAIIVIKSQSIDSVKPKKEIYKECLEEFKKYFEILDKVELDPYEKDHLFVVMRLK